MIKEAIILAGGMGTRLQSVITEIPKPMAPVGERPFLSIILDSLSDQGIEHIILSVGYKHEVIYTYFGNSYKDIKIDYAIENEALGTGGAVSLAMNYLKDEAFIMMNGDTLFDVDLNLLSDFHHKNKSDISIALKPVINQNRYGLVKIDDDNRIIEFAEKQPIDQGLINGGVYISSRQFISTLELPKKYSWEKNILEKQTKSSKMYGFISNSYFIDIGIPSDYAKAQSELR